MPGAIGGGKGASARTTRRAGLEQTGVLALAAIVLVVGVGLGVQDAAQPRFIGVALLAILAAVAVLSAAPLSRRARRLAEANRRLVAESEARVRDGEIRSQSDKMDAIRRITGGVAHDFNNMLMVVSSGLDLIDRAKDEARREGLKAGIRQALDQATGLNRQLLAFSRRTSLKSDAVDLAREIADQQATLELLLRPNIRLDFASAPGLWQTRIDASQFELALSNLIANARDAMASGGVITVRIDNVVGMNDGLLRGDFVRLNVTDEGDGMDREVMAKAFEPFFTTRPVGQGAGLGLSQVYGFAQCAGGEARLMSRPGEGTTVSLYLPRAIETSSPADPAAVFKPARGIGQGGQLLVVEDDDNVAGVVTQMLEELGYRPIRAPTATAALAALERVRDFDMVFSDMVLPGGMDGIELAREIGRLRPELPVLLTTGFGGAADAARTDGLRLLAKPYDITALAMALEDTLMRGKG